MKLLGTILMIAGILGTIVFGIRALENSESFNLLGLEVAVSSANWTPVIISVIVLVVGLLLRRR
ncbi:hypothetical protein [Psychroflexus sediminis]|uniref:hypothetical protein n=1 Tax=Psychroflexus sediminis TaxID=470826 RepID=UPI000B88D9CC|nr:hypothetical protein [Psychroflexus sediminis]